MIRETGVCFAIRSVLRISFEMKNGTSMKRLIRLSHAWAEIPFCSNMSFHARIPTPNTINHFEWIYHIYALMRRPQLSHSICKCFNLVINSFHVTRKMLEIKSMPRPSAEFVGKSRRVRREGRIWFTRISGKSFTWKMLGMESDIVARKVRSLAKEKKIHFEMYSDTVLSCVAVAQAFCILSLVGPKCKALFVCVFLYTNKKFIHKT